mmetsp:Transcript_9577/g.17257  ORF Transcript_9577/g.17257 Transcript_9577/m.17257 type:complete len:81 (-) Transcript_9577:1359-1601(-)
MLRWIICSYHSINKTVGESFRNVNLGMHLCTDSRLIGFQFTLVLIQQYLEYLCTYIESATEIHKLHVEHSVHTKEKDLDS